MTLPDLRRPTFDGWSFPDIPGTGKWSSILAVNFRLELRANLFTIFLWHKSFRRRFLPASSGNMVEAQSRQFYQTSSNNGKSTTTQNQLLQHQQLLLIKWHQHFRLGDRKSICSVEAYARYPPKVLYKFTKC